MRAVSDHAFDGEKIPPELQQALNYRAWGVGNIMTLPAGLLPRMNVSLNVYRAIQGYRSAGNKSVEWTRRNPQQWEIVSALIADRKRGKHGDSTK